MPFDPDTYLSESQPSFDPDAYLSGDQAIARPLEGVAISGDLLSDPTVSAGDIEQEMQTRSFEQPVGKEESPFMQGVELGAKEMVGGISQRVGEGILKLNEYNTESLIDDYLSGNIEPTEENLNKILKLQERGSSIRKRLASDRGIVQGEREKVRPSREESPVRSILGNVAGQMVVPIPGGQGATIPARVAGAVAGGAASGFIQPTIEGESPVSNALIGAGFALGLQGIQEAAVPFVTKFINARKGNFKSSDMKEMLDLAEREGVDIFSPDVVDSPAFKKMSVLAESFPGVGPVSQRMKQNIQQKESANRLAAEFGDNLDDMGVNIQSSLKRKLDTFREISGNKFNKAADILNPKGTINTVKLDSTLKKLIKDETAKGTLANKSMISTLQKYIDAPRGDFNATRSLRQALGDDISDFYTSNQVIGRRGVGALQSAKNALEDDLNEFARVNGGAGGLKAYRSANEFYQKNVIPFKKGVLSNLIKTNEPEKIIRYLSQHKSAGGVKSRSNMLYGALDEQGKDAVRGSLIRDSLNKASDQNKFSPAKFATELEGISNVTGVFFNKADKKRIDGISKIMRMTERAGQVAENPPNGLRLLVPGGIGVAFIDPAIVIPSGIVYATAFKALYKSKAGRNILLAASKSTPGSRGFENIMSRANSLIVRAVATENEKQQKRGADNVK